MSVSRMKKLTVFAYKADADAIIRKLLDLRCVDIRDAGKEISDLMLPQRLDCKEMQSKAEERLANVKRVLPVLTKYTSRKRGLGRICHRVDREAFLKDGTYERTCKTVEKAVNLLDRQDTLKATVSDTETKMQALTPWIEYDLPLCENGSKRTECLLGVVPIGNGDSVKKELEKIGAYAETVNADERNLYFSVIFCNEDSADAAKVLASYGFTKISFPYATATAQNEYDRLEQILSKANEELIDSEESLRDLAENLDEVEILSDIEETTVIACKQKQKLAMTERCVMLTGWVPVFAEDAVAKALAKFECAVETSEPDEKDDPPVLLKNNAWASNFEWVIKMYAYPRYGTYDPTWIMSIFYFVIFGLMFADVGYGLLLILGCFGGVKLLNPKVGLRRMMMMFGYCGISSIVFGMVFGGWFGDLPTAIMQNMLHLPIDSGVGHFFGSGLWFNPLDDPMTFLILSLVMGGVHIVTGMALNLYIKCKEGHAWEGICTTVPLWVLFAGLVLLVFAPSEGKIVSLVGVGLILIFNGVSEKNPLKRLLAGFGGLYGLVSYASDLLSYSRILALGLVAGVIAKVINLITALGTTGPVGFVVMLIILIAGHGLNLAINVLGTFVHTSRLQYLEFFNKFYQDGGTPFDPAMPADQYTEIQ